MMDDLVKGKNEVEAAGRDIEADIAEVRDEYYLVSEVFVPIATTPLDTFTEKMIKRLNGGDCPIGKGWQLLEHYPDNNRVVSAIFRKRADSYKYYEVEVGDKGVRLKCYLGKDGNVIPARERTTFDIPRDEFENLIKSLTKERRGMLEDVLGR